MLCALGRTSEAAEALSAFLKRNPASPGDAALELAEIRLEAGDHRGSDERPVLGRGILSRTTTTCYLPHSASVARVRRTREGGGKTQEDKGSARLACREHCGRTGRMPVAAGRCRRGGEDHGDLYRGEFASSRTCPTAFAALDRIYAHEGAASSAELRRWAADSKKLDNARHSPCSIWHATKRERARPRRAGSSSANSSRSIQATFWRMRRGLNSRCRKLPRDRAQEALQTAQAGQGFRNSFVPRPGASRPRSSSRRRQIPFCKPQGRPSLETVSA